MPDELLGLEGGAGEGEGQEATGGEGTQEGAQEAGNQQAGAGEGEGGLPKWHGVLPKAYQGHEALKDVEGMDKLLESYVGLKQLEGATVVPDKDASDEVKANFFKKIGVPEKAEAYAIDKVEVLEGMTLTGEIMPEFKQLFHNLKLSQMQANELFKGYMEVEKAKHKAMVEAETKAKEKAKESLKSEYKADFDKNMNIANKALKEYVDEEAYKRLKSKGFTSDADVVEMFYRIGKATLDDSVLSGTGAKSKGERPKDAQGRPTFSFANTKAS
jgi:hypothetical protein